MAGPAGGGNRAAFRSNGYLPGCRAPGSPDEWDEMFRQLEEELARAKKVGAPGRIPGPLPPEPTDGPSDG
jgi:hypothetical protein